VEAQTTFKTVRLHDAITADLEKRLLIWIARRLPTWINSDHLTAAGVLAMLGVGGCFWIGGWALAALIPLLVVAGAVSMSWNALAFAAVVENAGHRRSGVAIGVQQTVLNSFGAIYPGLFGAFVGLTTWTWGFLAVALLPVLGHRVLRGLPS
jgi:hypothetical protein